MFLGDVLAFYDFLAQTSKFVCVILLPQLFESWFLAQLVPIEALSRFLIQERYIPVQDEVGWIAAAG